MKSLQIFLVLIGSLVQANAQQVFSNIALSNVCNCNVISFDIPREINVMHYRIEASNDNANFDIIGILRSSGNSMLPKNYHYSLCGYSYKYYRITMVGMNAVLQTSQVLTSKKRIKNLSPLRKTQAVAGDDTITAN